VWVLETPVDPIRVELLEERTEGQPLARPLKARPPFRDPPARNVTREGCWTNAWRLD
jgi:hypothetical protein